MDRILVAYVKGMDRLTEWIGNLSVYLVLLTVGIGFSNVVLRYFGRFAGRSLTSNLLIELQWYLYSLIFLFGFAYILKNNINVRVDFWYADFSPKKKAWVDFIGHLIALIPLCILAIYVSYNPVLRSWGLRPDGSWGMWEVSSDPNGLPRAPIKSMIIFGFGLLLLQALAEMVKLYYTIRDKSDLLTVADKGEAPIRIE